MSKSEKKRVFGKKPVSKTTKIKFGKRLKANYLVLNKLTTEQIKLWVKYQAKPVISRFKNGINGLANAIHLWSVRRSHKLLITQDWMRNIRAIDILYLLEDDDLALMQQGDLRRLCTAITLDSQLTLEQKKEPKIFLA